MKKFASEKSSQRKKFKRLSGPSANNGAKPLEELAQKEEAELAILQRFLPQPLSEEEVKRLIRASITEAGATGVQDLGKVMKLVMPKVSGRSDGKRVNDLVRALLGG
jgi:uncharacterized protein YqeY